MFAAQTSLFIHFLFLLLYYVLVYLGWYSQYFYLKQPCWGIRSIWFFPSCCRFIYKWVPWVRNYQRSNVQGLDHGGPWRPYGLRGWIRKGCWDLTWKFGDPIKKCIQTTVKCLTHRKKWSRRSWISWLLLVYNRKIAVGVWFLQVK